jgi:hypothetical protein
MPELSQVSETMRNFLFELFLCGNVTRNSAELQNFVKLFMGLSRSSNAFLSPRIWTLWFSLDVLRELTDFALISGKSCVDFSKSGA